MCSFAQTSVALTRVLCQIFRIGEHPSEIGYITEFIPALIPAEEPFKEVFCITIQLLFKTWRVGHVYRLLPVSKNCEQRDHVFPMEQDKDYAFFSAIKGCSV